MGRRTEHISAGEGGRGGPILGRTENGPQRIYHGKRGGPVHHMMVGPRHVTHEAKQEKLPAQLRTQVVAVLVETLMGKKKKHGGMDSDPFLYQIPSPSSHSQHHIYSVPRLPVEGAIDTNEMGRISRVEMVQWGRLVGAFPWGRLRVGLRPRHLWIYQRSPTNCKSDCPQLFQVPRPNPLELWRVQRDVVDSAIGHSGVMAVSEY